MRRALPQLRQQAEQEYYRRLIPGYVRRFVERAAPLLDLRIEGDPEQEFAARGDPAPCARLLAHGPGNLSGRGPQPSDSA